MPFNGPFNDMADNAVHPPLLHEFPQPFLVIPQNHLPAANHNGPPNQVRLLGHELQRLIAIRRMLLHPPPAVQVIPGIQEVEVVARPDQGVELFRRQSVLPQVVFVKFRTFFQQETSCFAAARSSGFEIHFQFGHGTLLSSFNSQSSAP